MEEIGEPSRKRGRSETGDGEDGQLKLAKRSPFLTKSHEFSYPQSFIPTTTEKNSFLRLHIQILRSLYAPDSPQCHLKEQGGDVLKIKDDGEVKDETFQTIQRFVKQRSQLGGLVKTVKLNKGIQEEASKCLGEEPPPEEYSLTPSTLPDHDAMSNIFARSSSIPRSSQQSPYQQRFLSGSYRTSLSYPINGSFNLLGSLLKRKYLIADKTLRHETRAFNGLLESVKQRIKTIESLLTEQKGAPGLQSPGGIEKLTSIVSTEVPENEIRWEMISKLETKRRLWTMLLHDMENADGA